VVILPAQEVHLSCRLSTRSPCEEEALEGTAGIREAGGFKSSGLSAQMLLHIAAWQWSSSRRHACET